MAEITIIWYTQNQKMEKTNNLSLLEQVLKAKGLNSIAKIGYGHICLNRETFAERICLQHTKQSNLYGTIYKKIKQKHKAMRNPVL